MFIGNFTRWNNDWITSSVDQVLVLLLSHFTFWVKIPSYHTGYDDSGDG